tara:strand:- start:671 stop:1171 length:501 start_codon:yes stop_codon:yes gene_type:complete
MFPHPFRASYTVTIHNDVLRTALRVENTGDAPFSFTGALHSYFGVAGIENARVLGLGGLSYLDKVPDPNSPARKTLPDGPAAFAGETDRVYLGAPDEVSLDVGTGAAIQIQSRNWPDCVVWNPWQTMEECYKEFCCVENATADSPVALGPGEEWTASAEFTVVNLN